MCSQKEKNSVLTLCPFLYQIKKIILMDPVYLWIGYNLPSLLHLDPSFCSNHMMFLSFLYNIYSSFIWWVGLVVVDWCSCVAMISSLQYGRIMDIELKVPPRPPCYCFVEVFILTLFSTSCGQFCMCRYLFFCNLIICCLLAC